MMTKRGTQIPDRLTQALNRLASEAGWTDEREVAKLTGDASNRSYYRISCHSKTWIAMLLAEVGPNSLAEEVTKTSRPITELPYLDIQRYLDNKGVRVPKMHAYDGEAGVLILEDFGDHLLVDQATERSKLKELYLAALDQLEQIALVSSDDARASIAFARKYDRDLYNWEFHHFVEYALDKHLDWKPKSDQRDQVLSYLFNLTEEYLDWDKVFCHRDYHSRNLMLLPHDSASRPVLGVIDFQDALLAPPTYDLASLLRDSYIRLDSDLKNELVEAYRLRILSWKLKGTASSGEFRRAFDLIGLQRNLKAAGRFCYIDQVKRNPSFLAFIPRTVGYVQDTLNEYDELKPLKKLLAPHLKELIASCPPPKP